MRKGSKTPITGNSPPSSRPQIPPLPLQAALKRTSKTSAGILASPFAAIQGQEEVIQRASNTGRRCKFDLQPSNTNILPETQQQEQQQQQEIDMESGSSVRDLSLLCSTFQGLRKLLACVHTHPNHHDRVESCKWMHELAPASPTLPVLLQVPIKELLLLSTSSTLTPRNVVIDTDELLRLQCSPRPNQSSLISASGSSPPLSQHARSRQPPSLLVLGGTLPQKQGSQGSWGSRSLTQPGSLPPSQESGGQIDIGEAPEQQQQQQQLSSRQTVVGEALDQQQEGNTHTEQHAAWEVLPDTSPDAQLPGALIDLPTRLFTPRPQSQTRSPPARLEAVFATGQHLLASSPRAGQATGNSTHAVDWVAPDVDVSVHGVSPQSAPPILSDNQVHPFLRGISVEPSVTAAHEVQGLQSPLQELSSEEISAP